MCYARHECSRIHAAHSLRKDCSKTAVSWSRPAFGCESNACAHIVLAAAGCLVTRLSLPFVDRVGRRPRFALTCLHPLRSTCSRERTSRTSQRIVSIRTSRSVSLPVPLALFRSDSFDLRQYDSHSAAASWSSAFERCRYGARSGASASRSARGRLHSNDAQVPPRS